MRWWKTAAIFMKSSTASRILLKERFNIEHTTIQLETESREDKEFKDF